jgi:MerR family transcriptional regulator, light-induced transcriptional regulator
MSEVRYSIKIASERSGVSSHLIRMWEKRYGALSPDRTETNRRLYSDDNVERLSLLFNCTKHGHRIGNIASLPTETLRQLAQESSETIGRNRSDPAPAESAQSGSLPVEVRPAFRAIEAMNVDELRKTLDEASVRYGYQGMLTKVVIPLMQHIGRLWSEGELTAAYEHFASAALRTYLLGHVQSYSASRNAPVIITVTPSGQLHEFGAVVTAAAANSAGWHVIHLGPSLPASEIAGAAIRSEANIVALSLVHPPDDPDLPGQLRMLRRLLPASVGIVVGGRASESYRKTLMEIQAQSVSDIGEFYETLNASRRHGPRDHSRDSIDHNLGRANG